MGNTECDRGWWNVRHLTKILSAESHSGHQMALILWTVTSKQTVCKHSVHANILIRISLKEQCNYRTASETVSLHNPHMEIKLVKSAFSSGLSRHLTVMLVCLFYRHKKCPDRGKLSEFFICVLIEIWLKCFDRLYKWVYYQQNRTMCSGSSCGSSCKSC